jgi:excisionase family DNA binding protein
MKLAYTVEETAVELQLSERTVRDLIKSGKLIARKCTSERGIRVGRMAIEAFLMEPDSELIADTNCINPRSPKRTLDTLSAPKQRRKAQ